MEDYEKNTLSYQAAIFREAVIDLFNIIADEMKLKKLLDFLVRIGK